MTVLIKRFFFVLGLLLTLGWAAQAEVNQDDPSLNGPSGGATFSAPNGTLANAQGVPQRCSQNCDEGKSVQVPLGANTNPVVVESSKESKGQEGVN